MFDLPYDNFKIWNKIWNRISSGFKGCCSTTRLTVGISGATFDYDKNTGFQTPQTISLTIFSLERNEPR